MTSDDIHTLTGAYVVDAVSDAERRAFENHMAGCPACAQEVRELRQTTARLANATAALVPPTLWLSVRGISVNVRQLPPLVTGGPVNARARWRTAVAAACVAASVVVGVTWHNESDRLSDQLAQSESQLARITAILGAPDAQTVHGTDNAAGTVTVVMSRSANGMVITTHGLKVPTSSESLQVWSVTTERQKISLGLLDSWSGTLVVSDLAAAADISYLAITLESRDGSRTPSDRVVASATIA
jgi:anti-sigma-K factor RskA